MNKREQALIDFKKQPMTEGEKAMLDKFEESKQGRVEIKELRLSMGMNQAEFAKYYGIPVRTLQGWEQGRRKPPVYLLELLKRIWNLENR